MKIGDEVYVHGYVDEIHKGTYVDIVIIRNNGGYFGTDASEVILADRKTEPQTETHGMTEDDAFYIVFKDLTKDEGLFTGRYDAKHGSRQYMHGVSSVMEYIAYRVGKDCLDAYNAHFVNNLIESEEKAERSK